MKEHLRTTGIRKKSDADRYIELIQVHIKDGPQKVKKDFDSLRELQEKHATASVHGRHESYFWSVFPYRHFPSLKSLRQSLRRGQKHAIEDARRPDDCYPVPDHRMGGKIDRQLRSGALQFGPRADKRRRRLFPMVRRRLAQRPHQLSGAEISADLAGYDHEFFRVHVVKVYRQVY